MEKEINSGVAFRGYLPSRNNVLIALFKLEKKSTLNVLIDGTEIKQLSAIVLAHGAGVSGLGIGSIIEFESGYRPSLVPFLNDTDPHNYTNVIKTIHRDLEAIKESITDKSEQNAEIKKYLANDALILNYMLVDFFNIRASYTMGSNEVLDKFILGYSEAVKATLG